MAPGTDGGLIRRRLDGRIVTLCPLCGAGDLANVIWCGRCALHHIERCKQGTCEVLGLLQARHDARKRSYL